MDLERALEILDERGFDVVDLRKIDFKVSDPDWKGSYETEESIINFAYDQLGEMDEDD